MQAQAPLKPTTRLKQNGGIWHKKIRNRFIFNKNKNQNGGSFSVICFISLPLQHLTSSIYLLAPDAMPDIIRNFQKQHRSFKPVTPSSSALPFFRNFQPSQQNLPTPYLINFPNIAAGAKWYSAYTGTQWPTATTPTGIYFYHLAPPCQPVHKGWVEVVR